MSNLYSRVRFRKDDPLRDLHVPARDRLARDPVGDPVSGSDAIAGGDDTHLLDQDIPHLDPDGPVVSPEELA